LPPRPGAYDRAVIRARRRMLSLDRTAVREIQRGLNQYADDLARQIRGLKNVPGLRNRTAGLRAAVRITRQSIQDLETAIANSTTLNRRISFQQVSGIYQDAQNSIVATTGIKLSTLGAIPVPDLNMFGAFDAIGSARTWRSLQAIHMANGAREVAHIVRLGLVQGVSADVMARRLRFYVKGSESFQKLFSNLPGGKSINLASVPPQFRSAAKRMVSNSMRIAVSEIHNARAEAEIQHGIQDPLIRAIKWTLAPDRGSQQVPDQCDFLARGNFYGLGNGVYPVNRVPSSPHPNDRCERIQLTRSPKKMKEPKADPTLRRTPDNVTVPGLRKLTPRAEARARRETLRVIRSGDRRIGQARTRTAFFEEANFGPESVLSGKRYRWNGTKNSWERYASKRDRWAKVSPKALKEIETAGLDKGFGGGAAPTVRPTPKPKRVAVPKPKQIAKPSLPLRAVEKPIKTQPIVASKGAVPQFVERGEATTWVNTNLGMRLSIKPSEWHKLNQAQFREMLDRLRQYKKAGLSLPQDLVFQARIGGKKSRWGQFTAEDIVVGPGKKLVQTQIRFSLESYANVAPAEVARLAASAVRRGWWSSASSTSMLDHELGHFLHQQVQGISWLRTVGPVRGSLRPRIINQVSRYAATNTQEFVAEVWTGLLHGKSYTDDLIRYYKELGGALPPKVLIRRIKKGKSLEEILAAGERA